MVHQDDTLEALCVAGWNDSSHHLVCRQTTPTPSSTMLLMIFTFTTRPLVSRPPKGTNLRVCPQFLALQSPPNLKYFFLTQKKGKGQIDMDPCLPVMGIGQLYTAVSCLRKRQIFFSSNHRGSDSSGFLLHIWI